MHVYDDCTGPADRSSVWRNHAARRVVDPTRSSSFLGLSTFIVYSTWAAFQGDHYTYGPYLSPFYSPEIFGDSPHSWFGPKPASWPAWLPFSPALLILPIPGLFRFTCYYYRGATTRRSGPIRRRAPSASRERATAARTRFRSSSRTFIATAVSVARRVCSSCASTSGRRSGSRIRRRERSHSASASARSFWRLTAFS